MISFPDTKLSGVSHGGTNGITLASTRDYFDRRASDYVLEASWIKDQGLIDLLVEPLDRGSRFLDVCAGPGILASAALDRGCDAIALDVSMGMLCQVPRGVTRVCGKAERIPLRGKSVDVSVCRQGLHYVADLDLSLREIVRVSCLEIRVANVVMWSRRDIEFWRDYARLVTPARTQYFGPGELQGRLEGLGLEIIEARHFSHRTRLAPSIRGLDPARQKRVLRLFSSQPARIVRSYEIDQVDETDYAYSVRWDMVRARIPEGLSGELPAI